MCAHTPNFGRTPRHCCAVVGRGRQQLGREHAVGDHPLLVVEVVDEHVERPQPLGQAGADAVPLGARDHPRDDVERPGAVDVLTVGVDGERDPHREDVELGDLLALGERLGAESPRSSTSAPPRPGAARRRRPPARPSAATIRRRRAPDAAFTCRSQRANAPVIVSRLHALMTRPAPASGHGAPPRAADRAGAGRLRRARQHAGKVISRGEIAREAGIGEPQRAPLRLADRRHPALRRRRPDRHRPQTRVDDDRPRRLTNGGEVEL